MKGGDIRGALPLCPLLLLHAGVVLPAAVGLTVNQMSSVLDEADIEPKRSREAGFSSFHIQQVF